MQSTDQFEQNMKYIFHVCTNITFVCVIQYYVTKVTVKYESFMLASIYSLYIYKLFGIRIVGKKSTRIHNAAFFIVWTSNMGYLIK